MAINASSIAAHQLLTCGPWWAQLTSFANMKLKATEIIVLQSYTPSPYIIGHLVSSSVGRPHPQNCIITAPTYTTGNKMTKRYESGVILHKHIRYEMHESGTKSKVERDLRKIQIKQKKNESRPKDTNQESFWKKEIQMKWHITKAVHVQNTW